MTTPSACEAEIVRLHDFLTGWFDGTLPETDEAFAAFADVIAEDFVLFSPRGVTDTRKPLLAELRGAHGARRGGDFRIDIRDFRYRLDAGDIHVATYEEWQSGAGPETARLATAIFREDAAAPHGLVWAHLHETWLKPPPA